MRLSKQRQDAPLHYARPLPALSRRDWKARVREWALIEMRQAEHDAKVHGIREEESGFRRAPHMGNSSTLKAMNEPLRALVCRGRDGKSRTFWYAFERDEVYPDTEVIFRVHRSNPAKMGQENWFEMSLRRCANNFWKIIFIGDAERRPHYKAAGIPDALIPEASRVLQAPVRSSSNTRAKNSGEFRTVEADKMWRRLCGNGVARYVEAEDYYVCYAATARGNDLHS